MAVDREEVQEIIRALIPELSGTAIADSSELDIAIDAALAWHSRFKPMPAILVGTASGSGRYTLPENTVVVRRIEYPLGAIPSTYISHSDWETYEDSNELTLVFKQDPGSGNMFAVHYWADWTLDNLPPRDLHKLSYLAAAWLCIRRATISASSSTPLISADTTDFGAQAKRWMELHDKLVGLYASASGLSAKQITEGAPDPAMAIGAVRSARLYRRVFWSDSHAVGAGKDYTQEFGV